MTAERGLSMERALERAVLLERLRRRRALRRAAQAVGQPAARAERAAAPRGGEAPAAD